MKSCGEMRKEAWGILNGKWFWRLLAAGILLQGVAFLANAAVSVAFKAMSITSVGEFLEAKARAAQQGLSYSLPTAKAYFWMVGGFCLQTFIGYVFAAIFAFGFAGLLLKVRDDDDSRWLAESFGGFARPLEVTGLLVLINLIVFLMMGGSAIVFGGLAGLAIALTGMSIKSPISLLLLMLALAASLYVAMVAAYSYRQAWFLKSENRSMSPLDCLGESRRMMRGFKAKAFFLDVSYSGWIALVMLAFLAATMLGSISESSGGIVFLILSFLAGAVGFWLLLKTMLGMAVSRVVFYRELPTHAA